MGARVRMLKSPSHIRLAYDPLRGMQSLPRRYLCFFRACNRLTNIVMLDSSHHQPLTSKCQRSLVFFLEGPGCRIESIDVFVCTPLPKNVSSPGLSRTAVKFLIVLNTQYFTLRTASLKSVQQRAAKGGSAGISELPRMAFPSVFGP